MSRNTNQGRKETEKIENIYVVNDLSYLCSTKSNFWTMSYIFFLKENLLLLENTLALLLKINLSESLKNCFHGP